MKTRCIYAGLILLLLSARNSQAQTDMWVASNGVWTSPPNWSFGTPANNGSADVSFGVASPFSSTVNNDWDVNSLFIANSSGSFDLFHTGPHTLTVESTMTDHSPHAVLIDVSLLGGMNLFLTGSGTLTFSQNNFYSGFTALSSGTLTDSTADAFSPNSVVMVGPGSTLAVNYDETVSALSDNSGGGTVDIAGGAILTMNGSSPETFSGFITGAGGIQLGGTNVLTLTGANNYSGATLVGSGSAIVAGNNMALGSSGVTLSGAATLNVMGGVTISNALSFSGTGNVLAGSGTLGQATTVDTKVILSPSASPGNGPGDLSFGGALTLASGGTISFHLFDATGVAGTGFGLVTANAGLTLTAAANTLVFDLVSVDSSGNPTAAINFNSATSYSWKFAASSSPIVGFAANQFNLDTSGFANATNGGSFSFTEVGNNLFLNFTPVPEPSTWAMIATGILVVAPVTLRRKRSS
jgi:autotransporter-associated beta strand protein